jgi:hypothetical protein
MAGNLTLQLQRELFEPAGEQILSLLACSEGQQQPPSQKAKTKKGQKDSKDGFLVLVSSSQPSIQISIIELKGGVVTNEGLARELPKRKRSWPIKVTFINS